MADSLIRGFYQNTTTPFDLPGEYRKLIRVFVVKLKLLNIDRKSIEIKPSKNTEQLYDMLVFLNFKEGKDDVEHYSNHYVSKIWHIYMVFVLYYYILYAGPFNRWLSEIT